MGLHSSPVLVARGLAGQGPHPGLARDGTREALCGENQGLMTQVYILNSEP